MTVLRRRDLLALLGLSAVSIVIPGRTWGAARPGHPALLGPHPTPRAGITGAKVMTAEELAKYPNVIELFDQVRAMPEIVDGIRCSCGCADIEGYYSLLTCYEGPSAMARYCPICQGTGRLIARLHQAGQSLDQIREAVDARWG